MAGLIRPEDVPMMRPADSHYPAAAVNTQSLGRRGLTELTYAWFRDWDWAVGLEANARRLLDMPETSDCTERTRRDIARVLAWRLEGLDFHRPLIRLAQCNAPMAVFRVALIWHVAHRDALLADFLANWLMPAWLQGQRHVTPAAVAATYHEFGDDGIAGHRHWSRRQRHRLARDVLGYAADAGLLQGTRQRSFCREAHPLEAVLYIAHAERGLGLSDRAIINDTRWRWLLMDSNAVVGELLWLHQHCYIHFQIVGSLVMIDLPHGNAEAYVNAQFADAARPDALGTGERVA